MCGIPSDMLAKIAFDGYRLDSADPCEEEMLVRLGNVIDGEDLSHLPPVPDDWNAGCLPDSVLDGVKDGIIVMQVDVVCSRELGGILSCSKYEWLLVPLLRDSDHRVRLEAAERFARVIADSSHDLYSVCIQFMLRDVRWKIRKIAEDIQISRGEIVRVEE